MRDGGDSPEVVATAPFGIVLCSTHREVELLSL